MLTIYRESETELQCLQLFFLINQITVLTWRAVCLLTFHLERTCRITSWCHAEEEESGSLFLKSDICEEWVPKLQIVEKIL